MVFFAVQKLVSLIRSPLFICGFISITLGDLPKKTKVQFMSENILPMLSSRSFMASCLIFQSLNHCEIFLCSVRVYSNSTDLHAASNYTSTWLALEESLSLLFLYLILHVSILKFFKTHELGDGCGWTFVYLPSCLPSSGVLLVSCAKESQLQWPKIQVLPLLLISCLTHNEFLKFSKLKAQSIKRGWQQHPYLFNGGVRSAFF